jgi:hypothetical protein
LTAYLHFYDSANRRRLSTEAAADEYTVNVVASTIRPRCLVGHTYDCARRPYTSEEQVVDVQLPTSPIVPDVSLSASATVASCDPIVLNPTASSGIAGLNWQSIVWSVEGTGDVSDLVEYLNTEAVENSDSGVVLPNNFTQSAENFVVTLTLTNFFGLSSNSSVAILSADGHTRPNTGILGSTTRVIYRENSLKIASNASIPACLGLVNRSLSYVWKVYEMIDDVAVQRKYKSQSNDPRRFDFAPYTLNSSTTYKIEVTSYLTKSPTVNSSYSIMVDTLRKYGTSTLIRGGDLRTISAKVAWKLDASLSTHLDYPDTPLTYLWTCVQEYPVVIGNVCNTTFVNDEAIVYFTDLHETVQERRWVFTVVTGSQLDSVTSSASTVIIVAAVEPPVVTFGVLPVKQNPEATFTLKSVVNVLSLTSVTAVWSVLDSDSDLTDYATTALERELPTGKQQLFSLAISPDFFHSGRTYTLQLTLTSYDGSVSWLNQADVLINTPPYGGVMEISPSSGFSLNTTFYMKTNSWRADTENLPLLFAMNYYSTDPTVPFVLLFKGTVRQVNALLGAGLQSNNYEVTCSVTATDIFDSEGSKTEIVIVEPLMSAAALSATVNNLLADAEDEGNNDRVAQISSAASQAINSKNCSNAPNCTTIFRKACNAVPDTCSACIDGYYGSASGNTACVSTTSGSEDGRRLLRGKQRMLVTDYCLDSSECDVDQTCLNNVCIDDKQTCPGDCSGKGECIAIDSTLTVIPECLASDVYCSVGCACDTSFYGAYCEYDADEYAAVIAVREKLCLVNADVFQYLDSSLDGSLSTAVVMELLLQDINQLTDAALDACTTVIFETIAANPELAGDDSLLTFMLSAISNAIASDAAGTVNTAILDKMEAAIQMLIFGVQASLPAGLSKSRVTKNVRILLSKLYPSDLMGQTYSVPTSTLEDALGTKSAQVILGQTSPDDTLEVAVSVSQLTNNPSGASINGTGVTVYTLFYSDLSVDSGNQTSDRNVIITLHNVKPVAYQGSEASVLNFQCEINLVNDTATEYLHPVMCGNEELTVLCPGDATYAVETTCIPAYEAPKCMTSEDGETYAANPNCVVLNYTADTTTCSCSQNYLVSVGDRYVTNPLSMDYSATLVIIGTSFVQRFDTVNSLSLATLANNIVIVSFMAVVLGLLIFGVIWFLYADYRYVCAEAINDREKATGAVGVGVVKKRSPYERNQFRHKVIPMQFAQRIWYKRYWEMLKDDWSIMAFVYTRSGRDYRYFTLTWIFLVGKLINFLFVGTVIAVLFFADDEQCNDYKSESTCIDRLALDFTNNLCAWDNTDMVCTYNTFNTSIFSTLIATLVIQVLVAPIDSMLRHFLLMVKVLLVAREDGIRKEILVENPDLVQANSSRQLLAHSSSTALVQRQAKYILAARFQVMKETIDQLDPYNELYVMMEMTRLKVVLSFCLTDESRQKIIDRRHMLLSTIGDFPSYFPTETKTLNYKASRTLSTFRYSLKESVFNRPSYLSHNTLENSVDAEPDNVDKNIPFREMLEQSHTRYLLRNIKVARREGEDIVKRMESFPDDETREVYLMRQFIVDSMVGYRRSLCERFFFAESIFGIRSGLHSSSYYQWFCVFIIPAYLLFFCLYVFLFGISIGKVNTELFLVAVTIAFLEDTILVEPVSVLFYGIGVASLAYKDVTVIATRIFARVNSITTRVRGQMNPTAAYIQHLNPACRAARQYPHLHSARLLMSLNDDDIPSSYMTRYYKKGFWETMHKLTALLKAFIVLTFISVLPGVLQEGIVEATISIVFNTAMIVSYLALDFAGVGLVAAVASVFLLILIFTGISLIRDFIKRRRVEKREANFKPGIQSFSDDNRSHGSSVVSDGDSELNESFQEDKEAARAEDLALVDISVGTSGHTHADSEDQLRVLEVLANLRRGDSEEETHRNNVLALASNSRTSSGDSHALGSSIVLGASVNLDNLVGVPSLDQAFASFGAADRQESTDANDLTVRNIDELSDDGCVDL